MSIYIYNGIGERKNNILDNHKSKVQTGRCFKIAVIYFCELISDKIEKSKMVPLNQSTNWKIFNPIQTGLFFCFPGRGGGGELRRPYP